MSNLSNFTNFDANSPVLAARWTMLPVLFVVTFLLGMISNGTLLVLFIKEPNLRSSFNIYLINLLFANLCNLLLGYPLLIVNYLYSFRWFLGNSACTIYLYGMYVLRCAILNAHLLIAVNRIWCTVHPISYRSHHSVRTAIWVCAAKWLIIHIAVAPGWIVDALFYRRPLDRFPCFLNTVALWPWCVFVQLCINDSPAILMVCTLPIIYFTKKKRGMHRRKNDVGPINAIQKVTVSGSTATMPQPAPEGNDVVGRGSTEISKVTEPALADLRPPKQQNAKKQSEKSHGTLLLALLTLSVTICWTPGCSYYTAMLFVHLDHPGVVTTVIILGLCQTVLDPILFTLALPRLRAALRSLFARPCCNP